jgi:hypothetical protein
LQRQRSLVFSRGGYDSFLDLHVWKILAEGTHPIEDVNGAKPDVLKYWRTRSVSISERGNVKLTGRFRLSAAVVVRCRCGSQSRAPPHGTNLRALGSTSRTRRICAHDED